jgi:hypothetical protein
MVYLVVRGINEVVLPRALWLQLAWFTASDPCIGPVDRFPMSLPVVGTTKLAIE